jgi:uncharacterized membrane protein (UPF0127 family)
MRRSVNPLRPWLAVLAALLALACAGRAAPLESVEIVTRGGVRVIAVELAVTAEEQIRGLKFRRELAAGTGLLFDFGRPMMVEMVMQDTYLPLDMIFIRANGEIVQIVEDTTPLSNAPIFSRRPVRGVLEVAAGTARRFGIAAGDRVAHRIFTGR